MKKLLLLVLLPVLILTACAQSSGYVSVPMEDMEKYAQGEYILLDVRTQSEYDEGHIKGAVLFPNEDIREKTAEEMLPEKDTRLLVYCRSGNRSKQASEKLARLGYTDIIEIGGINSYKGSLEY